MNTLELVLRHRNPVLIAFLLITVASIPGLLRLRIDNRPEVFFVQDHQRLAQYQRFQIQFGRDQNLRIVIRSDAIWTREGLDWLRTVEAEVDSLFGVFGTAGLWGHHAWRFDSWPPSDINLFRSEVLGDRLDLGGGMISEDGDLVTIAVVLFNLDPVQEGRVLAEIERICSKSPIEASYTIVGLPVLSRALNDSVFSFCARYYPLLLCFAAFLLIWVFRTVRDSVAALGFVLVCETLVLGLAGYSGITLNFVNMVMVPILFVVALASTVHIQLRYRRLQALHNDSLSALMATYQEKAWPVFWAGCTTAVGFASMLVSEVPPIRMLGSWTAFGLALITIASFTLLPALLAFLLRNPSVHAKQQSPLFLSQLGFRLAAAAVKRRKAILTSFAVISLLLLGGMYRLEEETNLLRYFHPADPARQELERLEALGIGSLYSDLVVESPGSLSGFFQKPESLLLLAEKGQAVVQRKGQEEIFHSIGAGDLLRNFSEWANPESPAPWKDIERDLRMLPKLGEMYRTFVNDTGDSARLSFQIKTLDYRQLEPILDEAIAVVKSAFPQHEVWTTGRFPLILATQRDLLGTMSYSLGLTLLVILAVFLLLLRPGRLLGCAVAVNLWPILAFIGIMAWFSFPLDSTTIMVGSVALALAVDDTLHTLSYLRRDARGDEKLSGTVCRVLEKTAPAQILSSAILAGGFLLCSTTEVTPIAEFCLLAGLAILAALAADLVLLPALLGTGRNLEVRLPSPQAEDGNQP